MPQRNDPCKRLSQAFTEGDTKVICHTIQQFHHVVNTRDESHGLQTPLMRVCHLRVDQAEREIILNLMGKTCPDSNIRDGAGRTALCHACISEKTEVVTFLSRLGNCDPNIADDDGNTPLIYATKSRKLSVVQTLLSSFKDIGLDVNHRNERGVCALKEAENRCDGEICRILINVGADTTVLDNVQYPRDPRNIATPRTPTPDHIAGRSPQLSRKRNRNHHKDANKQETVLGPLVATRARGPSTPNSYFNDRKGNNRIHPIDNERSSQYNYQRQVAEFPTSSPYKEAEDEDRVSLADVDEADENEDMFDDWVDEGYIETSRCIRRRKNSLSLPDLRENGSAVPSSSTPSSSASGYDEGFHSSSNSKSERRSISFNQEDLPLPKVSEQEEYDYKSCPSGKSRQNQRRPSASLPDLRESRFLVSSKKNTPSYSNPDPRQQGALGKVSPEDSSGESENSEGDTQIMKRNEVRDRLVQSYGGSTLKLPQLNIHNQLTSSLPHLPKLTRTGFTGNRRPSITSLLNIAEEKKGPVSLRRDPTDVQLELRGSKVQSS